MIIIIIIMFSHHNQPSINKKRLKNDFLFFYCSNKCIVQSLSAFVLKNKILL